MALAYALMASSKSRRGRREVQIAQRLVGLRVGRIELGGGAELRGRLPAVAEVLVDHAERVLGGDELRIRLDGPAQELDRRLAAVLRRPVRGLAPAHVELVGAQLPGGRRPLLDARQLHVARGGLEGLQVAGGQRAQPVQELALRDGDRIQRAALDLVAAQLDEAGLQDQVAPGPLHLPEQGDVRAEPLGRGHGGRLVPRLGLRELPQAVAVDLHEPRHVHEGEHERLGHALADPLLLARQVHGGERQDEHVARLGRPPRHPRWRPARAAVR